ncbi:DNA repair protein RecN [Clostridia bacterium]|nr:DNA repair protein RecN [Clostridia bacterium]
MLASLHIKNIAVIDEAYIEFGPGFNALTGETGAGKSIIIDSLNMVLGQRTSRDLIRSGRDKAVVEAMFTVVDPEVIRRLADLGVEAEDGALLIYRDLNTEGRGVVRVNGMMSTAAMLRGISDLIINIHGQQDSQSLLVPARHVALLDSYAGAEATKSGYRETYDAVRGLDKRLAALNTDAREKERKIDLLTFQLGEIDAAKLKLNEDAELIERRDFLSGASDIAEALEYARSALYSGDETAPPIHDLLSAVVDKLGDVAKYDGALARFHEVLSGLSIDLDDVTDELRGYADHLEFAPNELDEVEERLDLLSGLKRKYGASIADILAYRAKIGVELEGIVSADETKAKLEAERAAAAVVLAERAAALRSLRQTAALELEKRVTVELAELDMAKVKFKVEMTACDFNPNGADNVEFLISTNAGEPLKPLSKIASGGEMSRIMLAIRSILADTDNVETLIFDEIDSGVSGRAAQKIAQKIRRLARKRQILCITHLAQIACMAATHLLIEKGMTDSVTSTNVTTLSDDGRADELARIIGGAQITELTKRNAREMLRLARECE